MLRIRVVPCLDVRDGRVVKGVKFQGLSDQGDPAALAQAYEDQGADEVVVLDVAATPQGRSTRLDTVKRVRERLSVPLTVGGGLGVVEHAASLLEAGADKVSVNTAAVSRPSFLGELAARFGSQCVVLAIDAARTAREDCPSGYEVVVRSGSEPTGRDAAEWAAEAVERGAGEILLTSFDRDGTREGYELPLLASVRSAVPTPIIASGGADSPSHMAAAVEVGADAVLAASIFHQRDWTVGALKAELEKLGVAVRPPTEDEGGSE